MRADSWGAFRGLLAAVFLASLWACGSDGVFEPLNDQGDYAGSLTSDGVRRDYLVHAPPGQAQGSSLPLLILLHGVPSSPSQMRQISGMDTLADQEGFVVAYPSAYHLDWATGCECSRAEFDGVSDVRFVRELIGELRSRLDIDPGRVFVAGYSQGAAMVHKLACDLSDQLAGAVSVAATMLQPVAQACAPNRPLSLMFFHGSDDQVYPREGLTQTNVASLSMSATLDTWANLYGCSSQPAVHEIPDSHEDGTSVSRWDYSQCGGNGDLTYFDIQGGGHTWPGSAYGAGSGRVSQEVSASAIIAQAVGGS